MQDEQERRHNSGDLRSILITLEANFRIYRRAAERYHVNAEKGFQLARNLLLRAASEPDTEESAPVEDSLPDDHPLRILTNRERQMLKLIASGHSTKQAASILGITFKTAVGHRSQLMKKLSIHDTANLVRLAVRTGLVDP